MDDVSEDERLARLSGGRLGRRCAGGKAAALDADAEPAATLVLDDAAPIDRRIEAALAMAGDADGGQLLIQLAAENQVASQLREAIGSIIFSNPDRSVRTAAAGFFSRPGGQPRMTAADVAGRVGDAARGKVRFDGQLLDVSSQRRGSPGADVGPDLTGHRQEVRSRRPRRGHRQPQRRASRSDSAPSCSSRGAAKRTSASCSPTADDLDPRRLRRVRTIAREELDARVPLKTSLMPDPLALALSEQDVADIAAFLMKRR